MATAQDFIDSATVGFRAAGESLAAATDALSTQIGEVDTKAEAAIAAAEASITKGANGGDFADPAAVVDNLRFRVGVGAVTETLREYLSRIGVYPEQFGAVGDGVADDAAALSLAMTVASNAKVPLLLSPGKDYNCGSGLTAPEGLAVISDGATISTAANITLLTLTTGCVVRRVRFKGPSSTYNASSIGVYFAGTVNGAGEAPTFVSGIKLIDCQWDSFGYLAIQSLYDDGTEVINPRITNCGYGGIITQGSKNFVGFGGYFDTFTGETGTGDLEAMAISWSCADNETDHVRYPPSRNCVWNGGLFKNCPTWAVLDTHGGEDCHFHSPTIIDCRRAVWLVARNGAGPIRCTATNVTAYNNFPEGAVNANGASKRDVAFLISGHDAANPAKDCHISGTASRFGSAEDAITRPAATMARTDASCSMDIKLLDPYCVGFSADAEASGFVRAVIDNPQSSGAGGSITSPAYLAVTATAADNVNLTLDVTMRRSKPTLNTYVGVRGVVSSGALPNVNMNFQRLSFDAGIDMGSGSDAGTLTGEYPRTITVDVVGLDGVETVSVTIWRKGNIGYVSIPLVAGISDSGSFLIASTTPLPLYMRPADTRRRQVYVMDNEVSTFGGLAEVGSTGTITLYTSAGGGSWTPSGKKRLYDCVLAYSIT